ncbi:MAG: glycosyltransferase family 4 protein [Candidatus Omnitrophica bacterium]|nr:glycosyltransferase family 4 protein [Candidatus Omnitrophota bacterium]
MSRTAVIPLGSFHLSGGVKVLIRLATGLIRRGWAVRFLVPDYGSQSPLPLEQGISVQVVGCGPASWPKPLRQFLYYLKLCRLSARGADLILANYYLTAYCAFFSSIGARPKPAILWYIQAYEAGSHGILADAGFVSRGIRTILASVSYRLPLRIFCVSEWVKKRIGRKDAEVLHPPALDLSVFIPCGRSFGSDRLTIGVIGRKGKTKGYGDFLKALETLKEKEKIRILVVAPGPPEVPLPTGCEAQAIRAQREDEMAAFYRRCDIFVLSSRMEGFPLPPLEAMACGCAVVTTDCGGMREYAKDGTNCLIVPAANPRALAQAILRLLQDSSLRRKLIGGGQETAERFGWEPMLERFLGRIPIPAVPAQPQLMVK